MYPEESDHKMATLGRNDLCHCGSGKKYKRCCLEKDQADERPVLHLVTSDSTAIPQAPARSTKKKKIRISDIRNIIEKEMEWENRIDQMLANHLVKAMEPEYDEPLILEAVSLWNGYSLEMNPIYQKYGSFCAALEYFIVQAYGFPVTQADLAVKYNVSAATISKRFQDLLQYAEILDMQAELRNFTPAQRMDMERTLRNLELAMQDQQFQTQAEAETFINQWMKTQNTAQSRGKRDKREEAQDLLFAADGESSAKKRAQFVKQALELHPDSPDAYRILAEDAKSIGDKISILKKGMQAGERDLGKSFFDENKGHFWGIASTRPYMRVKHAYAELSWLQGNLKEAASQFEELLELNTMDNLGVRYMLAGVYLEWDRLQHAERLLRAYEDDASAVFAYSRLILEYKKKGITAKLVMLYNAALQRNEYVPEYLFGKRKMPNSLPNYIGIGDENEAISYVATHSRIWVNLPELLQWMAGRSKSKQK